MLLLGPFTQILTMNQLPLHGPIPDSELQIIPNAGIVINNGLIQQIDTYQNLKNTYPTIATQIINYPAVAMPGFIDSHTHICFAGTRSADYALRIAGKSYLEIAASGGGIWNSVQATRQTTQQQLTETLLQRINKHIEQGVTTIEIKSGYGLSIPEEIKMLTAIQRAALQTQATIIPTCLAAHTLPKDFTGTSEQYLLMLSTQLFPILKSQGLSNRIDIFTETSAFNISESIAYLTAAKQADFHITVHADQFTEGSAQMAIQLGALSADHLEASSQKTIEAFAHSNTVATVLPGASLGLGIPYAPARKLLNNHACLAIASDWNPGSAPNGNLLLQAAAISAAEKLTTAETIAAITFRAAKALNLTNTGTLAAGNKAHIQWFNTADYRDILYYQGSMHCAETFIQKKH
jgi:imidazolonepropionase